MDKKFSNINEYRIRMEAMIGDVPLACLSLPKKIEKILISKGFLRVYDLTLFDKGFTEIEGIGPAEETIINTRLACFK